MPRLELVEQYNAWVRSVVPKDRMVEMRLSDGWGPLCKFLGAPIPASPFPHMNNKESMETTSRNVVTKLSLNWAVVLAVGSMTVWYMFA